MCISSRTVGEHGPHLEVAAGEADDGGLVQLGGDGCGQRQQLGQLVEFSVLLLTARLGRVLTFLLHVRSFGSDYSMERKKKKKKRKKK